jgi:hypothetical protein
MSRSTAKEHPTIDASERAYTEDAGIVDNKVELSNGASLLPVRSSAHEPAREATLIGFDV